MADSKLSALTTAGANSDTDLYYVDQSSTSLKITRSAMLANKITSQSSATLSPTDNAGKTVILCDCTNNSITITLPTAVSAVNIFTIKKTDSSANTITVATTSAQTIDGASTQIIGAQYTSIDLISNNANWFIT